MSHIRLGIAGGGTIACGLARLAAMHDDNVMVWARSDESAERVRRELDGVAEVVTDMEALSATSAVVEAVVENTGAKCRILTDLGAALPESSIVATTTSSLSVAELAAASGRPDRFAALHVFNPVEKMKLVEVSFPAEATEDTRRRVIELCEDFDKTPVEVPDTPGFVVNRLLFPYLLEAVRVMDETRLEPESVDTCMTLGAGHPMGPLKLLDFVGLDVAAAIGETIGVEVPERMQELIAAGRLGRKTGRGFYDYS